MSRPGWEDSAVPSPRQHRDLGRLALQLVLAGPVSLLVAIVVVALIPYLYYIALIGTVAVAILLTMVGFVVGVVAVVLGRGQWKGLVAVALALVVGLVFAQAYTPDSSGMYLG